MNRLSRPTTQGGQTFLHRIRMLGQIINLAFFFSSMMFLLTFSVLCYRTFSVDHHIKPYVQGCQARIYKLYAGPSENFKGSSVSSWIRTTERHLNFVHRNLLFFAYYSLLIGLVTFAVILIIWNRQGVKAHLKKTIAGTTLQPEKTVIKSILRKKQASPIKLMNLPLIKGTETQHILIAGTTGSGKTNAMKHISNQIRDQKAIIMDTNGEFLKKYYDPRCDIVLNPFDARFPGWDLWEECTQIYHYDEIAENLIPASKGPDQFWVQSSLK